MYLVYSGEGVWLVVVGYKDGPALCVVLLTVDVSEGSRIY